MDKKAELILGVAHGWNISLNSQEVEGARSWVWGQSSKYKGQSQVSSWKKKYRLV